MKLIQTLVPIASLALAVNGEYQKPVSGNQDVKFTQGGVEKVLDAKANGPKGDIKGAMKAVKGFFDRNPDVLKSIMKVVNDPKHKKAKDEIISEGLKLHSEAVKNPDSAAVKVKAINYVYQHPDILKLAGAIGKQVASDHPTLIENGFVALEKAAAKNPEIFKKIRAKAIEFSDKHEEAYEKIVEMVIKSALQDVKLSAKIAKKALKIDQIICSGSGSTDCACETDSAYGKQEPEVKSPEVDTEVPEVQETSEPEPEVKSPEVDAEVPEVQETSEPEPEVDAPGPEADAEVPEAQENSEPEPEVDAPEVQETSEPEKVGYVRPDVKGETPEVTDPVKPTTEPEVAYGKPGLKGEVPEVTDPVEPASEPEVTYEKPEVTDPEPPSTYGRPSGSPKAILDPK